METNKYKDLFLTESREYLSVLNNALVQLEKKPDDLEAIKEIFRAAHTLKGMSATMGYEPMAKLAHGIESALEPVRHRPHALSERFMDALLSCSDQLERWVEQLTESDGLDEADLAVSLRLLESAGSDEPAGTGASASPSSTAAPSAGLTFTAEEREVISQAVMGGLSTLRLAVEFSPECLFKQARAFMVLREVNDRAEIVKSAPKSEEIKAGNFENGFQLVVLTDRPAQELRASLLNIGDITRVVVEDFAPVEPQTAAPSETAAPLRAEREEKNPALATIRVKTAKLDKLMGLAQELTLSKIRFEEMLPMDANKELKDLFSHFGRVADELQDEIMKARLMPVKQVFERFPRMVRDLSKSLGKQVDLDMDGVEVELDRTIIEEMGEPLVHLLRNAVDHGIEPPDDREKAGKDGFGTILLQAKRDKSFVLITISDDGKGIDPDVVRRKSVEKGLITLDEANRMSDEDALRLIALPGFSTADKVSEVSGRGVGVDVAKTKVEALGGNFRIQSRKGVGTTFILRFPLTLAIIKALIVECEGQVFAIPVNHVLETVEVTPQEKYSLQQQDAIDLRGEIIPIWGLESLLGLRRPAGTGPAEFENILITEIGESKVGIRTGEVKGQQDVAVKSFDKYLKEVLRGFSGATVLGNGRIALVLDLSTLVEEARSRTLDAEIPLLEKETHAH